MIQLYNNKNKFKYVNATEKVVALALLLLVVVTAKSSLFLCCMFTVSFITLNKLSNRSMKFMFRLYLFPVIFLLVGSATLLTDVSYSGVSINSNAKDLDKIFVLFFRSLSAISIVFIMLTTTSVNQISRITNIIPGFSVFNELLVFTYRLILILITEAYNICMSIRSRNGFKSPVLARKSFTLLFYSVFRNGLNRVSNINKSLEARNYNGKQGLIANSKKASVSNLILIFIITLLLVYVSIKLNTISLL